MHKLEHSREEEEELKWVDEFDFSEESSKSQSKSVEYKVDERFRVWVARTRVSTCIDYDGCW